MQGREGKWTKGMLVIARALATVPAKYDQREDGLRCERGVIDLTDWQFRWGIRRLRWRGLIDRKLYPGHTIWASCRDIPFYSLTDAGRKAISSTTGEAS